MGYYVCVGVRNKLPRRRRVRLRLNATSEGHWGEQSASFQVRHRGEWSEIPTGDIHRVPDLPDSLDLDLTLPPGGGERDGTIFVSNYHWWPYTEMLDWLQMIGAGTVQQIGSSSQGRAVYAVEFGEPRNPTMVHTQTPQPSEMGSLACRAMIDFLGSGSAAADHWKRRPGHMRQVSPGAEPAPRHRLAAGGRGRLSRVTAPGAGLRARAGVRTPP